MHRPLFSTQLATSGRSLHLRRLRSVGVRSSRRRLYAFEGYASDPRPDTPLKVGYDVEYTGENPVVGGFASAARKSGELRAVSRKR